MEVAANLCLKLLTILEVLLVILLEFTFLFLCIYKSVSVLLKDGVFYWGRLGFAYT